MIGFDRSAPFDICSPLARTTEGNALYLQLENHSEHRSETGNGHCYVVCVVGERVRLGARYACSTAMDGRKVEGWDATMLRITSDCSSEPVRLRLEGRLAGPWVQELERCWTDLSSEQRREAVVDLAGVTYVGDDGKVLLRNLWRQGATLHACDCLMRSIVEEITGREANH